MPYVIRQIHPPGKSALAHEATAVALLKTLTRENLFRGPEYGDYLEWFDVNAKKGLGDDRWTDDVSKALTFETFTDAATAWKTQSKKRPFRDDGEPNRPLTAYSVTIERLP